MRADKLQWLRVVCLAFAAAAAASVALACGPMGGGSMGNGNAGAPPTSGQGGASGGGHGSGGGYSNEGANQLREGASDAAGANLGDDSGGGRSSLGGDGSTDLSSSISALGTAQTANGGAGGQAGIQGAGQQPGNQGQQAGNPGGGGLPPVWCLMQRQGPDGNSEQTVILCTDTAGAGPGWIQVASNLTFTAASALRDGFNAANQPTVWCVMQRTRPDGGREDTVIRCDNMGGAGPGWMPVASNLTFTAASAMRDGSNAGN